MSFPVVPPSAEQAEGFHPQHESLCTLAAAHTIMVGAQELEFLHSIDESDDELPVPLVHRSFLQNICDAFVVAIQR